MTHLKLKKSLVWTVLAALCSLSCDDGIDLTHARLDPHAENHSILLESNGGCLIDSDCRSDLYCFQSQCVRGCTETSECQEGAQCNERGRCISAPPVESAESDGLHHLNGADLTLDAATLAATSERRGDVELVRRPPSLIDIDAGDDTVTVTIETKTPLDDGRILYRVELEGHPVSEQLHIAEGTTSFTLQLPTGNASKPADEVLQQIQFAQLVTSVGNFNLTFRPRVTTSGLYRGTVTMREFGSGGLPIQFALHVEPPDASLESADRLEILLPVAGTELFSPVYHDDPNIDRWISYPLAYDTRAKTWYARIAHDYSLPADMIFGLREHIVRTMRIEISSLEDYIVTGALVDRWEGLFAERSADGVTTIAPVRLSGTLEAIRTDRIPRSAEFPEKGTSERPSPSLPPLRYPDACDDGTWSAIHASIVQDSEDSTLCVGMGDVSSLFDANSVARAACVLRGASLALAGPTTARYLQAFLDSEQDNPDGLSFEDFLTRCATQDGYCSPSPEVVCMAQLTASAYQSYDYFDAVDPAEATNDVAHLLQSYQSLSRERYLGRQLAAYQKDTQARLQWLQTSIAPLFLAAELRAYNEDILRRWEEQVLQTHYDVLALQYQPSDLEVLARVPNDAETQAARRTLLLDLTQTWQGTQEALQLAATRWNTLHQNDSKRAAAAASIQRSILELYLSAATLSHLNRSAGSTAFNTQFGSGFSSLSKILAQLTLPFSDLLVHRDSEVVLSQSVDPSRNNDTLLGDLERQARQAVDDAQYTVDRVISDAHETELNETLLTDRMQTQLETLRAELVSLCGLPQGCEARDVGVRQDCAVRTAMGQCGLGANHLGAIPDDVSLNMLSTSEAGSAVLAIQQALIEQNILEEEYQGHAEQVRILLEGAEAFERNLRDWDVRRRSVHQEIDMILDGINRLKNNHLSEVSQRIGQMQSLRDNAYKEQAAAVKNWSTLEVQGATQDFNAMLSINHRRMNAMYLNVSAELAANAANAIAQGIPTSVDESTSAVVARGVVYMAGALSKAAFSYSAVSEEHRANSLLAQRDYERALRNAEVKNLRSLADLNAQLSQNEIANLADELRILDLSTDAEITARESLIDSLRRSLEADLAYEEDLQELRDRQRKVHLKATELPAYAAQITQAEIAIDQRIASYQEIVQRAELLEGRFLAMNERATDIHTLLGSPAVIFSFANRLASAESRIERAKAFLYDWLVALEYYAVRPFFDQRLAILLARNPSQLDAIADDMLRLQRLCGGMINYETVDVSVRDQLLMMNTPVRMLFEGEERIVQPAERFRALLRRGNVPINTHVRYTSDETIGDLLNHRDVWALSFPIRLADFSNLPQTCNAKLASVAVQLVGDDLERTELPVVTVLYDGTSELISCQPNIDELVASADPGATNFERITRFRTRGRSASPIARVQEYGPENTANRAFEGLPFSTTYTLLIDRALGDNRHLNWNQLEDIRMRFTYAYQDVFPAEQCK